MTLTRTLGALGATGVLILGTASLAAADSHTVSHTTVNGNTQTTDSVRDTTRANGGSSHSTTHRVCVSSGAGTVRHCDSTTRTVSYRVSKTTGATTVTTTVRTCRDRDCSTVTDTK